MKFEELTVGELKKHAKGNVKGYTAMKKDDLVKHLKKGFKLMKGGNLVAKEPKGRTATGGRCWDGYEPVEDKKPYTKGSCKKVEGSGLEESRKKLKEALTSHMQILKGMHEHAKKLRGGTLGQVTQSVYDKSGQIRLPSDVVRHISSYDTGFQNRAEPPGKPKMRFDGDDYAPKHLPLPGDLSNYFDYEKYPSTPKYIPSTSTPKLAKKEVVGTKRKAEGEAEGGQLPCRVTEKLKDLQMTGSGIAAQPWEDAPNFKGQFEKYNASAKKKFKDLASFADHIMDNKDKFQAKTVKRARFFKNVLQKKKSSQ